MSLLIRRKKTHFTRDLSRMVTYVKIRIVWPNLPEHQEYTLRKISKMSTQEKKNLKSSGKKETSGKSKLPSLPSKKNDLAITFKKLSKFCSVEFCLIPLLVLLSFSRIVSPTPRIKYPYSGLFWSTSSRTWAEYGKIRSISPYSVRMWENADQNNSEYVHFSRSAMHSKKVNMRETISKLLVSSTI